MQGRAWVVSTLVRPSHFCFSVFPSPHSLLAATYKASDAIVLRIGPVRARLTLFN